MADGLTEEKKVEGGNSSWREKKWLKKKKETRFSKIELHSFPTFLPLPPKPLLYRR